MHGKVNQFHTLINQELHTLLYIKQKTNKDLLCSTGHSTQYPVIAYMGNESETEMFL